MLALGIDPGTAICGFGFVSSEGSRLVPHAYGALTDVMGIEQLFFNRNVTTAIPVGQARGVVLLAAAKNGLEIAEHTPLQVKQAVTGYGKARKEQVIYMVSKLLHLAKPPKPDDVADALAVAICTTHCMASAAWRNRL